MSDHTNTYSKTQYNPGDNSSTASGGYGSSKNVWSDKAQRGRVDEVPDNSAGLIDQSTTGGPIGDEIQDAKQGMDSESRERYEHEAKRDFGRENRVEGLNPYGQNPDSRSEAETMLASKYSAARGGAGAFEDPSSMNEA